MNTIIHIKKPSNCFKEPIFVYICICISSGQGENPDRRYSPRAGRSDKDATESSNIQELSKAGMKDWNARAVEITAPTVIPHDGIIRVAGGVLQTVTSESSAILTHEIASNG